MSEELGLQEFSRESGAIDRHEGDFGPEGADMDPPGDYFLSGAALAGDEDAGCAELSLAAKPPDGNRRPATSINASRWYRMVVPPWFPSGPPLRQRLTMTLPTMPASK